MVKVKESFEKSKFLLKKIHTNQGRGKPFSRGEKIKEQHHPGKGTFFERGACEIISRAKRAKNFSPPSRVFRPPLGPKCS